MKRVFICTAKLCAGQQLQPDHSSGIKLRSIRSACPRPFCWFLCGHKPALREDVTPLVGDQVDAIRKQLCRMMGVAENPGFHPVSV